MDQMFQMGDLDLVTKQAEEVLVNPPITSNFGSLFVTISVAKPVTMYHKCGKSHYDEAGILH